MTRYPENADPMLLLPRETPYLLREVLEKRVHGCCDELILDLGDSYLRFGVDIDTDTITSAFQPSRFRATKSHVSVQDAKPWNKYIGKDCGWTWFGWNQQGYLDTVLLSFDGIEPGVLLQTIASSIHVFTISPAETPVASGKGRASKAKTNGNR